MAFGNDRLVYVKDITGSVTNKGVWLPGHYTGVTGPDPTDEGWEPEDAPVAKSCWLWCQSAARSDLSRLCYIHCAKKLDKLWLYKDMVMHNVGYTKNLIYCIEPTSTRKSAVT